MKARGKKASFRRGSKLLAAGAAEGGGGEGVALLVEAGAAGGGAEEFANLVGEDAFTAQAPCPIR
jgi:hypothetical protein